MSLWGFGVSSLVTAIIAIVFGIIMLVKPQIVAYLIGAFLLFIGIMFFVGSCSIIPQ
jgi:hypothetical protein